MYRQKQVGQDKRVAAALLLVLALGAGTPAWAVLPPIVSNPIGTVNANEDDSSQTIDLDTVFTDPELGPMTYAVLSNDNAAMVTATISGNLLTLTFLADQNGTANISVQATDNESLTAIDAFTVQVTPDNDDPVIVGSVPVPVTVAEDASPAVVDLSGIVSDVDIATNGDSLSYAVTSNSNATLVTGTSFSGATLSMTLGANKNGASTVGVRVSDTSGKHVDFNVQLTVTPVNDPPVVVAAPAPVTYLEDSGSHAVSLAGAFSDPDGDALILSITGVTNSALFAAGGAPSVGGTSVSFTLAANANGSSDITIQARDPSNATVTTTLTVNVTPVDDAPTVAAPPAPVVILEDAGAQAISLAGVFADVDGDPLTLTVTATTNAGLYSAAPSIGGTTLNFTSAPDANGGSTITIRATDPSTAFVETTLSLTVTPVNDAPTVAAPPAPVAIGEDAGPQSISLTGVFTDVDGDALTLSVTGATNPGLYSTAPSITGTTLNFTSAPNANGASTITIQAKDPSNATATTTLDLTVSAVNDAPTANAVAPVTIAEDAGAQNVSLAGAFNDVDIATNGDSLTLSIVGYSNAALFSVAPAISGTNLTFTAAPNANGSSTITVQATDSGGLTANTPVSLTVTPANDAPVVVGAAGPVDVAEDAPPVAVDLSGVFSDPDIGHEGDSLTLSVVTVTNPTIFAPQPSVAGMSLNLSFAPDRNGGSGITIRATDSHGASVDFPLLVNVAPVNDAPTVANPLADRNVPEDYTTPPPNGLGQPLDIDLTNVFADVDIATNGDVLTLSLASNSNTSLVTAVVSGTNLNLVLVPDANGSAVITIQAMDTAGAIVTNSFTLNVGGVNDTPVAGDDAAVMDEDTGPITIDVTANDYLAEQPTTIISAGTTQVINGVSFPGSSNSAPTPAFDGVGTYDTLPNGSVVINGNQIEYTPRQYFNGTDFFTYTIADSDGDTSTATVTITINPVENPPLSRGGVTMYTIEQGQVLNILPGGGLASHAWDPDNDPISVIQDTAPDSIAMGFPGTTLNLQPDGSFIYTPDVAFVGQDRFVIRYYDGSLASTPVEIFVTVTPAAPPPPPPPPGEVEFNFQLANVPLETATSAPANVLVIMDDSGSMDWGIITNDVQGEFWVSNATTKDHNVASTTRSYRYITPLSTNVYGNDDVIPTEATLAGDADFSLTGAACAPLASPCEPYGVWRARNQQFNGVYYNPHVHYRPWVGLDRNNVDFANVDPTAAPLDPYTTPLQKINLTTGICVAGPACNVNSYTSSTVPKTHNGGSTKTVTNKRLSLAEAANAGVYIPAYYTTTAAGLPAWNSPHTLVEIKNDGTTYVGGPDRDDCAVGDGDPTTCTYVQEIQNFANWFTYYRSREYTAKAALGRAVSDASNIRMGYVVLNNTNERLQTDMLNASYRVGFKKSMMNQIYKISSNDGTPLRDALDKAGKYFSCKKNDSFGSSTNRTPGDPTCPVLPSPQGQCQNNFALLFTDGTWNENYTGVNNADGDHNTQFDGGRYADTISNTLADVAMFYYERDLQPTLADSVPTSALDRSGAAVAAFGNQGTTMHQHMSTYTIGFGVPSLINPASVPTDYRTAFNWGNTFNDNEKVDDLLHAAVNGRGQYLAANDPVLLSQAFQAAFAAFASNSVSVSAVAFNSTALREETVEYRGFFKLNDNTGDLKALRVDASTGVVDVASPIWRAAQQMDAKAPTNRVIFTFDRAGNRGVPFRFANLNANQQAVMDTNEVSYIRGDRSREEPAGGYRQRPLLEGLLGDIVHSAPQFVGPPRAIRRDQVPFPTDSANLYSAFKAAQSARTPLVYVGANDGMLHGFDAGAGTETMGYIPNKLVDVTERFRNQLDLLTTLTYSHKFFVDVTPSVEDVYMPPTKLSVTKAWATVMVGALGGGGKGYYALNVSNPSATFGSEANAAGTVLWEFTDKDDTYPVDGSGSPLGGAVNSVLDLSGQPVKDLGYAYSPAEIAMSNVDDGGTPVNKKWVGIFGNGYNSTAGIATLFVLNLEDGLNGWTAGDFRKITTGEGVKSPPDVLAGLPNGLGVPALVDKDLNGTVDLVYAGDLFGNLYRFDMSDTNAANWTVTKLFQATYQNGATTELQPITTQPFVMKHPSGTGYIVVFGTGSWITDPDGTSTNIQSVYGIWDRLEVSPPTANSNAKSTRLVQQTITNIVEESGFVFQNLRFASNNVVNYTPDSGGTPGTYGWYFDLNMTRPALTAQGNPNPDTSGNAAPAAQYPGERAIRRFVARGDALLVTTVVPRLASSCTRSPPGSTFPIDPVNGGTPPKPILDLNNDGKIDSNDMVNVGGYAYAAGILFTTDQLNGTLVDPSLLLGTGSTDFLFLSGGDQQLTLRIAGAEDPKTGRLSWRELDDVN